MKSMSNGVRNTVNYNFLIDFQVFPPILSTYQLILTELVISDYTSVE